MSFYKWYREVGYLGDDQNARAKIAYEAGAQSRQAEIDELIDMVKTSADSEMFLFEELQRVDKDRDELQERVDEVLIEMKNQLGDEDFCDMQRPDYDAMLYALRNIKDILKGKKDDRR